MLNVPSHLAVDPAFAPMLRFADNIYLTPRELARHWRMSVAHLGVLRHQGKGPAYTKVAGRVIYAQSDILAYEQSRRRGPVTPDSLALAIASVPGLPPVARDTITEHVIRILFKHGSACRGD